MSDFDEEAERERLREQYEREQQKREATEHMSELLLKGATMTDAHCEECGDPIFRYDGQTFCPTCKREVGLDTADDGVSAESTGSVDTDTSAEPERAAEATTITEDGDEPTDDGAAVKAPRPTDEDRTRRESVETPDAEPANDGRVEVPAIEPEAGSEPPRSTAENAGDLGDARHSLERTLAHFARQAESTDDPRRARDALEAVREAAGALSALDQVR